MFGDIPRNVWRHSAEYNIPPIPRVPRIPFLVPVFLFLYIASMDLWQSLFLVYFQHFLMSTFRRMRLNYENCSLRRILF